MEQKLETFLTVCKTMHYGRAAEALNLSQPAVSKHIQALEAQYGVRLFLYQNRRLKKTVQGEILEQYAISLRYNEQMLQNALREPPCRSLRIGATKSIGDYILFPEIRRYLERSGNELTFLVDNTAHLLGLLEDGALDFVVLEGPFDKRRYDCFLLRSEPFIGICAEGHSFAGREVTIPQLFSQRLILREEGSGTRRIFLDALAQQGWQKEAFPSVACISSFKLICELVKEGCGISFLYEAVVQHCTGIARFTCSPLTQNHDLNVVFLKGTPSEALARDFLSHMP